MYPENYRKLVDFVKRKLDQLPPPIRVLFLSKLRNGLEDVPESLMEYRVREVIQVLNEAIQKGDL